MRPAPAEGPAGVVIYPTAVYTIPTLTAALGLRAHSVSREVRQGRLRHARLSGRYWILGEWVLEWLREREMRRQRDAPAAAA